MLRSSGITPPRPLHGTDQDLPGALPKVDTEGSAKLRQSEQKWELNDFNDIVALPVAAVYCDVVVTEKQWVHRLRQGKVGQRYDTTLLSDTAMLADLLAAA